jgi:type IV pilus assembly protein PilC
MAVQVQYLAFDRAGSPVRGTLEAASVKAAEDALWSSGLIVARVRPVGRKLKLHNLFPSLLGPGTNASVAFARQLATLLDAGFPLLDCLNILTSEQAHPAMREATTAIRERLAQGQSFSEALAAHPLIFPGVFVRLARIGEETGDLAPLLRRAADHAESGMALRAKVRSTLTYPAIVTATAAGAIYVLLTFSIPMLAGLLEEFQAELPLPTRIVIALGNGFNAWATWLLALAVAAGLGLFLARRSSHGRLIIDRHLLLYPPFGSLLRRSALARLAQTLNSLLESGIPLLESLDLAIAATDNAYLRASLERVRGRLLEGASLSEALRREPVFPSLMREMVRVGESSGTLAGQLATVHRIYQQEFEGAVTRVVGLIEPLMILGVGALVGLIGATIITTVYSVLPGAQGAL